MVPISDLGVLEMEHNLQAGGYEFSYQFQNDTDVRHAYVRHTLQWRKLVTPETMVSSGTRLAIGEEATFDFRNTLGPLYVAQDQASVSLNPLRDFGVPRQPHSLFSHSRCPTGLVLEMDRSLEKQRGLVHRVWLADVLEEPEVATNGANSTWPPQVVVKFFIDSLYPWDPEEWMPAYLHAHYEAWAYNRLLPLQGTVIPRSYGFHKFTFPCGQEFMGHVLEYIDAPDIFTHVGQQHQHGRIATPIYRPLMSSVARVLYEMHKLGVAHLSLLQHTARLGHGPAARCTIRVTDENGLSVCIFDLGHARSIFDVNGAGLLRPDLPFRDTKYFDTWSLTKVGAKLNGFDACMRWMIATLSDPETAPWMQELFNSERVVYSMKNR